MSGKNRMKFGFVSAGLASLLVVFQCLVKYNSSRVTIEGCFCLGMSQVDCETRLLSESYERKDKAPDKSDEVYYWHAQGKKFLRISYRAGEVVQISGDPTTFTYGEATIKRGDPEEKLRKYLGSPWSRKKVGDCWGLEFGLQDLYVSVSPSEGLLGVRLGH